MRTGFATGFFGGKSSRKIARDIIGLVLDDGLWAKAVPEIVNLGGSEDSADEGRQCRQFCFVPLVPRNEPPDSTDTADVIANPQWVGEGAGWHVGDMVVDVIQSSRSKNQ